MRRLHKEKKKGVYSMNRYGEIMELIKTKKKLSEPEIWQVVMLEEIAKSLAIIADNLNKKHGE